VENTNVSALFNSGGLFFIIYFITPSVVALWVHDQFVPSERRDWLGMLFWLVSYGAFNFLVYYLLSPFINTIIPPITAPDPLGKGLIDYRSILFAAFILPAVVGFITAILPQAPWFQKLFRGKLLHPTPTAWDFIFSERTKSYLIMFHMKSGAKIGGLYSTQSYVSSFPTSQEIYVEEVWRIDEQGGWLDPIEDSAGAFIKMEECTHVELFQVDTRKKATLWQRIKTRPSSVLLRLHHRPNNKSQKNEKDNIQSPDLILSPVQEGEVVPSLSFQQIQVVKEEKQSVLQPQPSKEGAGLLPVQQRQASRKKQAKSSRNGTSVS
jgi:Family of unknown function (DUF6338)